MSYDDQKTLSKFTKKHGIGFPLLSDPGSRTIEAYEIRNREAAGSRIDGVPYPGTFIIDAKGVIRAKLFHDGYKQRHAGEAIIEAARGIVAPASP